ncbi:MAG: hypothetical protein K2X72_12875 [Reyranella sp.]|nr:hypothetical protein [Reyranella sp.]
MRWSVLLVVLLLAACAESNQPAQREFAVPDRMLGYTYSGGTTRPIANTGTGIVSGASLQSAY